MFVEEGAWLVVSECFLVVFVVFDSCFVVFVVFSSWSGTWE